MPVKRTRRRRPKLIGIYQIVCKANGKIYIGSSRDLCMRWNSHLTDLIQGSHHNSSLQADFDKYGVTQFSFSVLLILGDIKLLRKAEQEEIDKVNTQKLYNKVRAKK